MHLTDVQTGRRNGHWLTARPTMARPMNIISLHFELFSLRLFSSAQTCTCLSSLVWVSQLVEGTMTYVSSANFTSTSLRALAGGQSKAIPPILHHFEVIADYCQIFAYEIGVPHFNVTASERQGSQTTDRRQTNEHIANVNF